MSKAHFGKENPKTMNDLIWIGNTLYPRWFVIAIAAAVFIAPFVIAAIIQFFGKGNET